MQIYIYEILSIIILVYIEKNLIFAKWKVHRLFCIKYFPVIYWDNFIT